MKKWFIRYLLQKYDSPHALLFSLTITVSSYENLQNVFSSR